MEMKKRRGSDRMWRLLESPDDISLYLCENNCVCLCAYEIGGVEGGGGIVVLTVGVVMVYVYPLKSPSANSKHFKQTTRFQP